MTKYTLITIEINWTYDSSIPYAMNREVDSCSSQPIQQSHLKTIARYQRNNFSCHVGNDDNTFL